MTLTTVHSSTKNKKLTFKFKLLVKLFSYPPSTPFVRSESIMKLLHSLMLVFEGMIFFFVGALDECRVSKELKLHFKRILRNRCTIFFSFTSSRNNECNKWINVENRSRILSRREEKRGEKVKNSKCKLKIVEIAAKSY